MIETMNTTDFAAKRRRQRLLLAARWTAVPVSSFVDREFERQARIWLLRFRSRQHLPSGCREHYNSDLTFQRVLLGLNYRFNDNSVAPGTTGGFFRNRSAII